ncbi:hypothetical protein Q3C01_11740 [Bradyrhizobium sp. UFLA05-109]
MKKIVVATIFAAVTLAAYSAAACDWNREASAKASVVASTTPTTVGGQASQASTAQPTSVADEGNRKPVQETAPVVLVTDRH